MVQLTLELEREICELYATSSIEALSKKFNIGDRRIRTILKKNDIAIKDSHKKTVSSDDYMEKNTERFNAPEGFHYVAVSKKDQTEFADYLNKSGALISYIKKELGEEIPSLFKRKKYFHKNGKQWYEQFFDIVLRENIERGTKVCPYCGWETTDIENKSGMFMTHLQKEHNISIEQYLSEHPEDTEYFTKQNRLIQRKNRLEDNKNFVICPICGEKFEKLTYWHIKYRHNMNYEDFKSKYPETEIISDNMLEQAIKAQKMGNLVVSKKRFISKYEQEIRKFLDENNIKYSANRQVLIGKEIDILIDDKKIGIEFDGLKWHTEWFGKKSHSYHLDKTKICNEKGYGLIHIFEDEYIEHKGIVYSKLSHILNIKTQKKKAYGRKCIISPILKKQAKDFLEKYHIQGFSSASLYLGAFYEEELVGVMTFKNGNLKNIGWELARFATNSEYNCVGVGGKIYSYFLKEYKPEMVYSFADRRWTVDINSNLYTKLGFTINKINPPDYKYYTDKGENKNKRIHKMLFNKQKLHKKYGLPLEMTETEMAKALGYDRIWDCGLIKYVWMKK